MAALIDNAGDAPEPDLPRMPPTFRFVNTTPDKVQELLKNLSPSKSCGVDGLGARHLKAAANHLVPVLGHLFNASFVTKTFPAPWKVACVTALHKDGDRSDPNNYRPISVLPVVSKLLERLAHDQLYGFLTRTGQLAEGQSGFRKGHLT